MSIELHKQMSIPELISAVRMTMLRLRYSSATLLGHTNTNTTSVYLKIDMKMLKKCALEVEYENK